MTGERIKDLLGDKISHVYISTYPRAMETGHIILKHLDKGLFLVLSKFLPGYILLCFESLRSMHTGIYSVVKYKIPTLKQCVTSDVPVDYSELVREGAPIAPIPEPEYWKPEPWEFHRDGARIEAAFRKLVLRKCLEIT